MSRNFGIGQRPPVVSDFVPSDTDWMMQSFLIVAGAVAILAGEVLGLWIFQ